MTRVDWIALGFVAFTALVGLRKGMIATALSLVGLIAGGLLGARLAPHFLEGGVRSPYTPLAGLAGAALGAIVLETTGTLLGTAVRRRLRAESLRTMDTAGGVVLGAAAGFAVVWLLGAVALHLPGQTDFRRGAQRSLVVQRLTDLIPPARLMRALARVDPLPAIAGPAAPVAPPDPALLGRPGVRAAAPSVVRVLGTACGLGVSGSGWVAAPELVVTAAHVVAGQQDTVVAAPGDNDTHAAHVVAFDPKNDLAVLRVPGLGSVPALRLVNPKPGAAVVILGYPANGPFAATPARIGNTSAVFARDAYGHGPVARTITSIRGRVRHGNSGGPAVDARGAVQTTVFASRAGSDTGYGVPATVVRRALASARGRVSTGSCTGT